MKFLCKIIVPLIIAVSGLDIVAEATPAVKVPDVLKLPEWSVNSTPFGGNLLLSDSPEMVLTDGILYQDTVTGDNRLFFHHVNGTNEPRRFAVMLENPGNEPVHVTVYKYGLGGPSHDYLAVGKAAQLAYLGGSELYILEVPANGSVELVNGLSDMLVQPNALVNGIYDFVSDKPVKVKVLMAPQTGSIQQFGAKAKVLPPDQHRLRGTFVGKDRLVLPNQVYDSQEHGMVTVTLADNNIDKYSSGIDATDGSQVLNYGNYGVVYRLFMPSATQGKQAYYLNPRGGEYAGAIGVKYNHNERQPVPTPVGKVSFGANKVTDIASLGSYEGGKSLWFTFSPPGASNLPVKLLIVPETLAESK